MVKRKSSRKSSKKNKKTKFSENLLINEERKELQSIAKETNGKVFEVEKLLKKKTVNGKNFYLVKWKNWNLCYNQWIEEKGILYSI